MVAKTYKGDKVTKLTVEETFRFRGNIGSIVVRSKGAVNAKLDELAIATVQTQSRVVQFYHSVRL